MTQPNRREFLKKTGVAAVSLGAASVLGRPLLDAALKDAPARRPNILFFFPDQHRPDWLGSTPNLPAKTPHLDALAARGVRFTNAVCPSPLCAPSRAALAAGKEYDRCGVAGNGQNYPLERTTFYRLLRESGYHVAACGKFDLRKASLSWGRDGKQVVDGKSCLEVWGFSDGIDNSGKHDGIKGYRQGKVCPYFAYLEEQGLLQTHVQDFAGRSSYDGKVTPLPDEAYADNWIARNGLTLIRRSPKDKPWFLQVNFNGPHEPMDVTQSMKDRWKGVKFPPPNGPRGEKDHDGIRQNYSAMVENIDRWLGAYVEELKARGELDRTLIVYSSDHGEMLGDHGLWGKSKPYQPSAGVPLVAAGPGVRSGWVCDGPATTLDLAATFLEAGGAPVPADMDSRSMLPLLAGKTDTHRSVVRSGLGKWRLAFDGRYKLIRGIDPSSPAAKAADPGPPPSQPAEPPAVLFDLKEDPLENTDIAAKAPDIVRRLAAEL